MLFTVEIEWRWAQTHPLTHRMYIYIRYITFHAYLEASAVKPARVTCIPNISNLMISRVQIWLSVRLLWRAHQKSVTTGPTADHPCCHLPGRFAGHGICHLFSVWAMIIGQCVPRAPRAAAGDSCPERHSVHIRIKIPVLLSAKDGKVVCRVVWNMPTSWALTGPD